MARSLRPILCAATALLASAVAHPGRAELDYHVAAGASIGASDNPRGQSDQATGSADGFVSATGQLDLSHVGSMTSDRLGYGFVGMTWLRGTQGSSQSHTLRLTSAIEVGATTNLSLRAGAMFSRITMLDTAAQTDSQIAGPRPAGDQTFLGVDAGESLGTQIGGSWRIGQTLDGRLYRPLGSESGSLQNLNATVGADINRTWASDSAGLRGRVGWITSSSGSSQTGTQNRSSEFAELLLSWQHEWTTELRHSVGIGGFVVRTDQAHLVPSGSANLVWHRNGNEIELRAMRTADSNVILGAAFQRYLAGLRAALPIDHLEQFRVMASVDLEHDSIDATSTTAGSSTNVVFVNVGLRWQPGDMFVFGLQYTFRDQHVASSGGSTSDASGTASSSPFFSLRCQTAMLTVGMQYPPARTQ